MAESAPPPRGSRATAPLILIFVLGAVCGAALFYVGQRSVARFHHPAGLHAGGPAAIVDRLTRELDLDADQKKQVEQIINETHTAMRDTVDAGRAKIRALLRPDQQKKFDDFHAERERRRAGRGGGGS